MIDPTAFPSTPQELFWSTTPSVLGRWVIGFGDGQFRQQPETNNPVRVRCVHD